MKVAIIMPARFASTRFPGKPLAMINGKPLIEWVYIRARLISGVDHLIVATDDDRIADVVRSFGGTVAMTDEFDTGTDRVAAVAEGLDVDIVVNLQGDEPVFDPATIENMIAMLAAGDFDITTAAHAIAHESEFLSPNVVKVLFDRSGLARYFSRSPIPSGAFGERGGTAYRHVGMYAYRRTSLMAFTLLDRSPLELSEGLEQLRALENTMRIGVVITEAETFGVDVPDDVINVEKALTKFYTEQIQDTVDQVKIEDKKE